MSDVTINYKGSAIATMDASGTKTLETGGKYCEDDIEVVYTKPAGPSGTKQISISQNGTTTEDVTNYAAAQITANVPNTYSASDEGKVVSSGALVAQGSDTVTQNDTYDTTLISSLTVNVSGGGGGGLQLLGSGSYTYSGSATQNILFPVSYTGTPKILLCLKDSQDAGIGETLGGYKVLATGISTIDAAFTKGTCAYLIKSAADAVMYQGVAPGDTQCIYLCSSNGGYDAAGTYMKLSRYGNAYLMQPGSYSYYIYG